MGRGIEKGIEIGTATFFRQENLTSVNLQLRRLSHKLLPAFGYCATEKYAPLLRNLNLN
jgi:hypothetical protein